MEENKNVGTTTTVEKEGSKFGWGVLGFFFPIVGFILFLVWMKTKKEASKASGIGALIGFILGLISTVLFFVLGFSTLLGISSYIENEGIDSPTKIEEKIKEVEEKIETTNKSIKIDSTKEYVYDANYDKGSAPESYSFETETYYLKDIVVPYININSDAAKTANENIKGIFDELMASYMDGANGGLGYVKYCEYKYYINGNILSVVFKTGTGATGVVFPYYHTYNFDLTTGNKISYEYAYGLAGFNSSSVYDKVKSLIEEDMKNYTYHSGEWSYDSLLTRATSNYSTSVENGTIEFYFDDNNKLNIQAAGWIPGEMPEYNREILKLN